MKSEKMETDVKTIKEWISKQPHLPQNVHDVLIKRLLHCNNNSIEQTKNLIELFYTVRSQAPEIFSNRDPKSPEMLETFENFDFISLPNLTNENNKVFVYRIVSDDTDRYHFVNALKLFFIMADVRMVSEDDLPDGEVPIFDMKNFTLRHLAKINLPVLKKYMVYTQEAHPIKLKQIHAINAPSFVDRCVSVVKPFVKNEILKMVNFHTADSDTLQQFIPNEILPEEYGGKAGSISTLKDTWRKRIMEYREYIIDETRWKVDEAKRPNNTKCKREFGMEGSFRTLQID